MYGSNISGWDCYRCQDGRGKRNGGLPERYTPRSRGESYAEIFRISDMRLRTWYFSVLIFLMPVFIGTIYSQSAETEVNSYDLRVRISPDTIGKIAVDARLQLRGRQSGELYLLVGPSMEMTSVEFINERGKHTATYTTRSDTLRVSLPTTEKARSTEPLTLRITYTLDIEDPATRAIALGSWYPWQPNDLATYSVRIEGPKNCLIVTSMALSKRRINADCVELRGELAQPIPHLWLVITSECTYRRISRKVGGKQITFFYDIRSDSIACSKIFDDVCSSLRLYGESIGPYRYEQLTLIDIADTNMQYVNSQPALILVGSAFIMWYKKYGVNWPGHEVAHQWFGSGVFFSWQDPATWCMSETIAEFLNLTYLKLVHQGRPIDSVVVDLLAEFKRDYWKTNADVPLLESKGSRVTYTKGVYAIQKLRLCLGDEKWDKFLKQLYMEYEGGFLHFRSFVSLLTGYDKRCADDFYQLVGQAGLPEK
jgi:aminopeptidase N